MRISPDTPGYIAPDRHYVHVPNYAHRPAPKRAKGQIKGNPTIKIFKDVRNGKTTTLIDA